MGKHKTPPRPRDPHRWGPLDWIRWQAGNKWRSFLKSRGHQVSHSSSHLAQYKDTWVRDHRETIISLSSQYRLPPEILAGIAWTEVGGDPDIIDPIAHEVRSFDHAADPLLEPLTITRKPALTSAGDVSIQIRRAAEILGYDPDDLSYPVRDAIVTWLQNEELNLYVSIKYLSNMLEQIYPGYQLSGIGDQEIMLCGYLYNLGYPHPLLGPDADLKEIPARGISNYGHDLLKKRAHMRKLLNLPPLPPVYIHWWIRW